MSRTVKKHGVETTYFDKKGESYEQISYLNDAHDLVEPDEATECIIKTVRKGQEPVYTYCRMKPKKVKP